jgi:hypothetical protein
VPDDDDVLDAYEQELVAEPPPRPRTNRGFWVVVITIGLASVLLVGEILLNRPIKDTIAHAEHSLRTAQGAAERIREETGSFSEADADRLADVEPGLHFMDATTPSAGLDEVSVAASEDEWAAAVMARPGACFYLHLSGDEVLYGVDVGCTARDALQATDPRW